MTTQIIEGCAVERIVDGVVFEGTLVPDSWDVRVWESNGHRELSARNTVFWAEVAQLSRPQNDWDPVKDAAHLEERRLNSLKKAAERAKTMCRRVIKCEGFNELLTATYRENMVDRELCKKHFKEWVRRMKVALGGHFRYCASFEVQERGAMHVHIACHRLPTHATRKGVKIEGWRLGTAIWRSIVGPDNGLVFVGGRKAKGTNKKSIRRSPAKMAAYVSKYITKDYEKAPDESNRYSRSNGTNIPKVQHIYIQQCTLADLISIAFECRDGDVLVSHRVGKFGDTYWLCTEPDKPDMLSKK